MAVNRTIPGTYVTINDGNLVFNTESNNPNVFVLGTAADGPSYTPVKVGSYQQVRGALFGDEGSLVDGLHLVETTAAQSVYAVRINSKPAVIQGIGGAEHKIQTVLQDASAGTNYKVAYDSATQRLQVVNELNTIVYDNGSTPTVDLSEVVVRPVYTNTTVDIGEIGSVWISLEDLSNNENILVGSDTYTLPYSLTANAGDTLAVIGSGLVEGSTITFSAPRVVAQTSGTIANGSIGSYPAATMTLTLPASVASPIVKGSVVLTDTQGVSDYVTWTDNGTGGLTPASTGTPGQAGSGTGTINYTTGAVSITYAGAPTFTGGIGYNAYSRASATLVDTWSATVQAGGTTPITTVTGDAIITGSSIANTTGIWTLAWAAAGDRPDGSNVTVSYQYNTTHGLTTYYQAGSDGLDASRIESFESQVRAYDALEAVDVDVLIPVEASLDAPNVADLTAGQITSRGLDDATYAPTDADRVYPTKGTQQDVLGKVYIETYNGTKYFFWSFDGSGVAQVVPQVFAIDSVEAGAQALIDTGTYSIAEALVEAATTGAGTVFTADSFKEVNFAWEAAYFCYKLEVNDNSATCVVGVEPPVSYMPEDVNAWIGTPPTVDFAGTVTVNGSGLRGNKFMAGKITHGKGFWATDSGYLPAVASPSTSSDVLVDDNNKPVQIGKYLSVPVTPVIQASKSDVFGVGTTVSLHTLYGGSYGGVAEDFAMTNKSIPGVRLPFNITKLQAEQLKDARYVTMIANRLGTVIVEDTLATTSTSDFQNLTTIRIVTQLTEDIRDELAQYIGQGLNDAKLAAANTTIVSILNAYQKAGKIVTGNGKAYASPRDRLLGIMRVTLNVTPAFQIKTIPISISLTAPTA